MDEENNLTNTSIEQTRSEDNQNWLHPWEILGEIGKADRHIITHAEGIYVYDEDGNKLLDCSAGMWCVQIGYGRQEMSDVIAKQVLRLPYMTPFSLTSEPSARLAKKLSELAPADLNHIFFTTCGSTAVDSALRFVHFYNNILGRPYKKHIITQSHSYHGATYLCGMVSSRTSDESWFDVSSSFVHTLSFIENTDNNISDICDAAVLEFKKKILELGPENIGAFIAEPIQASGGIYVPPSDYLRRCWELCRQNDIIYISDEVVTGFGRLGHWFASKSVFNVEPDIITCAKGLSSGYLPIGAVLISDRLIQKIENKHVHGALFSQGFTYSGHPVSCAAALKNIEILEHENLLQNVLDLSPYFLSKLHELRDLSIVSETRGMGLLGAIEFNFEHELTKDNRELLYRRLGKSIVHHASNAGLLVRFLDSTVALSPPLTITKEQIDYLFVALRESLNVVIRDMEFDIKERSSC